ncbi:hypothetical protein TRIP_B250142 [uncultured Desulfatiglans sp.]|nr:hypothetical protein TRIP_B250142 [uncultured Desulfatiglans sp.]
MWPMKPCPLPGRAVQTMGKGGILPGPRNGTNRNAGGGSRRRKPSWSVWSKRAPAWSCRRIRVCRGRSGVGSRAAAQMARAADRQVEEGPGALQGEPGPAGVAGVPEAAVVAQDGDGADRRGAWWTNCSSTRSSTASRASRPGPGCRAPL